MAKQKRYAAGAGARAADPRHHEPAHLQTLDRPGDLAERLPKALIHHNVPGTRIHSLLEALDDA